MGCISTPAQHIRGTMNLAMNSLEGLLDAIWDYQRMAPHKLSDENLESILWNKVPMELQREVKEITDGSVQELLHKLLRAKEVLAERKQRGWTNSNPRGFPKSSVSNVGKQTVPLLHQTRVALMVSPKVRLQRCQAEILDVSSVTRRGT